MSKKHNWVNNVVRIDPGVEQITRNFLNNCGPLTPALEAKMDAMLATIIDDEPAPLFDPDPDILENQADIGQYDWMDTVQPPSSAFEF